MIAFRDILIFAGLMALAAAVIPSLFLVGEGASPVPACSDCAFKLTGGYWIRQYDNYAALYLGTREAARYGWAYIDGRPLSIGENITCNPMYLWVLNGVAYVSCDGSPLRFSRDVLGSKLPFVNVRISSDWRRGCTYTITFEANLTERYVVAVEVYDEEGRLVASATGTIPGSVSFSVPVAGVYRVHIYAPPILDEWHTLTAQVRISNLLKARVFTSNNTQDLRPAVLLKVFDLTNYWKKGYTNVAVHVNPAGTSFTLSAPAGAFADFLLAWEDCRSCDFRYGPFLYSIADFLLAWEERRSRDSTNGALYIDEVWRLTFTPSGPVLTRIYSQGFWHEVYADGQLIWTWNKDGPKNDRYAGSDPTITVEFVSWDSIMNAGATFTKVCSWR